MQFAVVIFLSFYGTHLLFFYLDHIQKYRYFGIINATLIGAC